MPGRLLLVLQSPVAMYFAYSSEMMPSSPDGLSAIVGGAVPMSVVYAVVAVEMALELSAASPLEMKITKFFWHASTIGLTYVCAVLVPLGAGSAPAARGLPVRVCRPVLKYSMLPASALFLPWPEYDVLPAKYLKISALASE